MELPNNIMCNVIWAIFNAEDCLKYGYSKKYFIDNNIDKIGLRNIPNKEEVLSACWEKAKKNLESL